jgi:hypothetical protein
MYILISLTFRTLNRVTCRGQWHTKTDSQKATRGNWGNSASELRLHKYKRNTTPWHRHDRSTWSKSEHSSKRENLPTVYHDPTTPKNKHRHKYIYAEEKQTIRADCGKSFSRKTPNQGTTTLLTHEKCIQRNRSKVFHSKCCDVISTEGLRSTSPSKYTNSHPERQLHYGI